MANVLQQRIGPFSRFVMTPESAPGVDGSSGYVLPLRDKSGFQIKQPTAAAPVFNQSLLPFGRVYGLIDASGAVPLGLEFLTSPAVMKLAVGSAGYVKTDLPNSVSYHDIFIPPGLTTIGSVGLQAESGESTAQYVRATYARLRRLSTSYAASGVTPMDAEFVGAGTSSVVDIGGTKTWNGYAAVSQFNGQASINNIQVIGMPNFSWNLMTGANPFYGAFNQGAAVSVNPGVININGNVELAMATTGSLVESDQYFANLARNQNIVPLECAWFNGPLSTATAFLNMSMPSVFFDLATHTVGGEQGLSIAQPYNMIQDSTASKTAAWVHGTVLGPFNITAGNNQFKYNIDASGATTYSLTTGSARTVAQIVTELNADATFLAKAVADQFGGYLRITSKTKGSTSSVQFVTVASDSNSTLGFNTTAVTGYNTPFLARFLNSRTTVYA
jgi:hypothetical protein